MMVLFANVNIGQYVEVKHEGRILCGTVRYKGHLNGTKREWIGIHLEYPAGQHNGCWRGRQYFKCPSNCGLFAHASQIRFRKSCKRSRDLYHKVGNASHVDETLFHAPTMSDLSPCYSVSKQYVELAKASFASPNTGMFAKEARYPLSHSVGRSIPAATMLKPGYSQVCYTSQPTHFEYSNDVDNFAGRSASISHYKMPHEALQRQLRRGGWEEFGLHRPRFSTV